jgi:D-sedoheptulose 7-phosphate isomerase
MDIKQTIKDSIQVKESFLADEQNIRLIEQAGEFCIQTFKNGGKVLFCGNGGSAADAQHLSAELSGRYLLDREPLFAEALHVNSSFVTAVANDYSYDEIFSRMVKAAGRAGDVLIGLSTSGNSANVVKALEEARKIGMKTIGMTGETGGKMAAISDVCIRVPSKITARIQETHILIGHIICEEIEEQLFGKD